MKKLILTFAILVSTFGFSQSKFDQAMGQAMSLWGQGKNTEASAMFERIAAAEKTNWLPNYNFPDLLFCWVCLN